MPRVGQEKEQKQGKDHLALVRRFCLRFILILLIQDCFLAYSQRRTAGLQSARTHDHLSPVSVLWNSTFSGQKCLFREKLEVLSYKGQENNKRGGDGTIHHGL